MKTTRLEPSINIQGTPESLNKKIENFYNRPVKIIEDKPEFINKLNLLINKDLIYDIQIEDHNDTFILYDTTIFSEKYNLGLRIFRQLITSFRNIINLNYQYDTWNFDKDKVNNILETNNSKFSIKLENEDFSNLRCINCVKDISDILDNINPHIYRKSLLNLFEFVIEPSYFYLVEQSIQNQIIISKLDESVNNLKYCFKFKTSDVDEFNHQFNILEQIKDNHEYQKQQQINQQYYKQMNEFDNLLSQLIDDYI